MQQEKNKLIYDEIVDGLKKKETISKIAKNAGVTRKTVYRVKRDLGM
ncbi:helix-turn-helix domain-containing protein [Enterococcus faecium]|nr:helix-turn-helix domain-containing protein [Enterococcus faecium]